MKRKPEDIIEDAVCNYARTTYGMLAWKLKAAGERGKPDRLFITQDGIIAFVEFKDPGRGKLSEPQRYILENLDERGCACFVIDDTEKGKSLVDLMADTLEFIKAVNYERASRDVAQARANAIVVPASVSKSRH